MELQEARERGTELLFEVSRLQNLVASGQAHTGLRFLGAGTEKILAAFRGLEERTHRSVWNLQNRVPMAPYNGPETNLNAASRAKALDMRLITTKQTIERNVILASLEPTTRIGLVPFDMIVLDGQVFATPGPLTNSGLITSWLVTESALVTEAVILFETLWSASVPAIPDGQGPPLSKRQVAIVQLIATGATDSDVARRLNVSPRTVSADLASVLTSLGLRNRIELVALLPRY